MKFLKEWSDYLKESLDFDAKKNELGKKREEIKSKIAKIESELNFMQKGDAVEAAPAEEVADVQVHELELKLESLRNELKDLDLL